MRPRRYLLGLVCLLATAAGCQTLHRYRSVPVLVRDAETKKPIPTAQVHLSYPFAQDALAPHDSVESTGPDGVAHVQAAPYGDYDLLAEASAKGYLPEDLKVPVAAVEQIEPTPWIGQAQQGPARFVIDLYSEPRFSVELALPEGFRGLVKAEVHIQDDMPCPQGLRCFRYDVAWSGAVEVKGPTLLRRVFPPAYRARCADGTLLGTEMTALKVGFRWLKSDGNTHYFVAGTEIEYDRFRRNLLSAPTGPDPPPASRGKTGGRGGRHQGSGPP
jgi:hypothetical protein